MTKHLLTCRVRRETVRCTIPRQIQRRTNDFFTILKTEATLSLVEQMEEIYSDKEKEGPYTNNVKRMDPVRTVKFEKRPIENK